MVTNKIGTANPDLYLSWADYEDCCGNTDRAVRILRAAIQLKIDQGSLQEALDLLQARGKENKTRQVPKLASSDPKKQATPAPTRVPLGIKKENTDLPPPTPVGRDIIVSDPGSGQTDGDNTTSFRARRNLGPPARRTHGSDSSQPLSPESLVAASPHTEMESFDENSAADVNAPSPSTVRLMSNKPKDLNDLKAGFSDMDLSETVQRTITKRNDVISDTAVPLNDVKEKKNVFVNGKEYMRSQLIGKGGSCKVFKIIDSQGHVFALKKVKLRGQDASVIKGYKNEIILLNKLKKSKRIIHLHDAQHDKESGLLLMVLEYGEIDLEQLLQQAQEQRLSINFVRNYWEQMLQAVQAIHEENIIHSDLKPAVLFGLTLEFLASGWMFEAH